MDFAKRAWNHSFHIDPIIRSLFDTDFYKLLMLQFIWRFFPKTEVEFSLMNRTKSVRLADIIDESELRAQLDHAKNLKFSERELVWLAGNKFYGMTDIFQPRFIQALRELTLTDYQLSRTDDGQWELMFRGNWLQVSLWEIISIVIVNTLRNRAALAKMSRMELDLMYAEAKVKAHMKVKSLQLLPGLSIIDFGTRRRHDFLWQKWNVELYADMLGSKFTGTSNALLAMELGLEAKGTNAHELPMVLTALAMYDKLPWSIPWGADDDGPKHLMLPKQFAAGGGVGPQEAQYYVLDLWQQLYGENLRIFLPDTYGTTQFLKNAPAFVKDWKGARPDSKPPIEAIRELRKWWQEQGVDPMTRVVLPCDGLDVGTIKDVHGVHHGKVNLGYGYGTWFSNDFRNCHPNSQCDDLLPISLVCKISHVKAGEQWVPAVKLSDNYEKACGPTAEIAKYREIFGIEGVANAPVVV